jgi:tRNA-specific 2-thiouridylase
MGKLDIKQFLTHFIETSPGNVLDTEGTIIGTHDGALFYTIGERHGFTIKKQRSDEMPRYVVSKDMEKNTITVSPRSPDAERGQKTITLSSVNWISDTPISEKEYTARIRYRQKLFPCTVANAGGSWMVTPQAPHEQEAPGQSLVLYDGDTCLGGGIIVE